MNKTQKLQAFIFIFMLVFSASVLNIPFPQKVEAARNITFPVIGKSSYSNDYNAPRDGGARTHHAIDILADKGQPLVAAVSGTIIDVQWPPPTWGYSVTIQDDAGYRYTYIHMNDDNPGTNDGKGGGMNAYAPYVKEGYRVTKGQRIGRVGDSGRANGIPHLHFEMRNPSNDRINPYSSLVQAKRISKPVKPPAFDNEILPYGPAFKGGINIAMGNLDIDQESELITGAGKDGGPHVKVYDTDYSLIEEFFAYSPKFKGGVDVAAGDVDGDGTDEIITAAGRGGGPHVKIFEADGTFAEDFYAYGSKDRTGVRVSAGDVDGDGTDEIITARKSGAGPLVKVFKASAGNITLIQSFNAYSPKFKGGVDVAAGDVSGSNEDEIITAAGPGGGPHVRIFEDDGTAIKGFYAYGSNFRGGVRVSAGDVQAGAPKSKILTVPSSSSHPTLRMFDGDGTRLLSKNFLELWWIGNYDVAAGYDTSRVGTGVNRRVSVKTGIEF